MKRVKAFFISLLKITGMNLLFLLIFLLILEGALRSIGMYRLSSRLIYSADGAWPPTDKEAYVILAVGDSFTFGGNVADDQTYPHYLWKVWEQEVPDKPVTIVNKGHCEYNSSQVLRDLKINLEKYTPDLVILLAGSSDKFNLVGIDRNSKVSLYRPEYEYEDPEETPGHFGHRSFSDKLADHFLNLRVVKMANTILRQLEKREMEEKYRNINSAEVLSQSDSADEFEEHVSAISETFGYQERYPEMVEHILNAIAYCPTDSRLFSESISLYYTLLWTYRFQDVYTAQQIEERMNEILKARPEYAQNKAFMHYLSIFNHSMKYEDQVERIRQKNLQSMIDLVKNKNISLILQNYPARYHTLNLQIKELAAQNDILLVDHQAFFADIVNGPERSKYFIGDDHCTPAGYKAMARNVFKTLKTYYIPE